MELGFVKLNPAGNVTVIVLDPLPRKWYGRVARQIMSATGLGAEQVGFMEPPQSDGAVGRLSMMGGEFCGNAARAFAAWLAFRRYPGITWQGYQALVPIEVSGHAGVLMAKVGLGPECRPAWASSPMPVPHRVSFFPFHREVRPKMHPEVLEVRPEVHAEVHPEVDGEGDQHLSNRGDGRELAVVEFEGICHVVWWDADPSAEAFREVAARHWDEDTPAFGVMFLREAAAKMIPLVAVRGSDSFVWEGSCASGSVAVASALAARERRSIRNLELEQPGGKLAVTVEWEERIIRAEISGTVEVVAQGTVWVELG